jgi:hypothetical protein
MHGHLLHRKGKEAKIEQYTGATIFVNHSTTYIHHVNQVLLQASWRDTQSKKHF